MKLPTRFLSQSGIVLAVSVALMGSSIVHGAMLDTAGLPGEKADTTAGRPSPDGPLEDRIKQAIEEVDRKGQAALAELGELDSPEKVARAGEILAHMDRVTREVKKRTHDRVSERFDELNDLAVARLHVEARADLRALGQPENAAERQQAEDIRVRAEQRREQLEDRWGQRREQLERRHREQSLPEVDFRQPNGRPPGHAPAYGLRLQLHDLSKAEAEAAVVQLEAGARTSLERLGELDSPGKVERARKIRARLEERKKELRETIDSRVSASRVNDDLDHQLEQQVQKLRLRAEAAIKGLGELDTPEKQEMAEKLQAKIEEQIKQLSERLGTRTRNASPQRFEEQARELRQRAETAVEALGDLSDPEKQELARNIQVRLEEELSALRERLADRSRLAFEEQVDQEAQALRRRAQAALDRLGELDTPEKQEAARRIRARLEEQVQDLRGQLARRARALFEEKFEQDSRELRRKAAAVLGDLGRLDSPEKVERARKIRARMEQDVNRLQRQQAERLRGSADQRFDPRAEARPGLQDQRTRTGEAPDRADDAQREHQEHRDRLETGSTRAESPTETSVEATTPPPTEEPDRETTRTRDDSNSGSRP